MLRRLFPLVAVAMLAFAPAVAASSFSASAPVAVSATGGSPFGSTTCTNEGLADEQAHSTLYLNSEVEPWVTTSGTTAVGAHQQDRWNDGGSRGIVTQRSTDSGANWTQQTTTKSSFCTGGTIANGGDFQRATDPWTAISPDGTTYLLTLSLDDPNTSADHAMLVMKSPDGGATWNDPTTLIRENNPAVLNDKGSLTADPNDSNYVYAVWDRLELPNEHARAQALANAFPFTGPALFSRTSNGGTSWSTPKIIFDTKGRITQTIGNQIVVLPDLNDGTFEGQLVDGTTYRTLKKGGNVSGFDNVAVIRSADHGTTWSDPIIVNKLFSIGVVDPDNTSVGLRTADDIADFAVDSANGKLYAVWEDARFSNFAYQEIAFSQSTDGGLTWSTPIKINKTPSSVAGLNKQAFLPSVDVMADGTVGVQYYDFRNNDGGAVDPLETDVWFVHCHSSCTTSGNWSENRVTTSSFDFRKAPNAEGLFLGDYQGLAHVGSSSFLSFFSQANSSSDPATVYASNVGP